METKSKIIIAIVGLLFVTHSFAQPIVEQRKGNIRVQGNLAGAYLFKQKAFTPYLTGDLDLFFDNHVSLAGSVWASLPLGSTKSGLRQNHAIFGGINYHFLGKGRWDPYIGFTPGLGLVQMEYEKEGVVQRTKLSPIPLLSASVGCNYYIGSIFNFFVKAQGVSGQFFKLEQQTVRLDDIRFTAGLGWNFGLWKIEEKLKRGIVEK